MLVYTGCAGQPYSSKAETLDIACQSAAEVRITWPASMLTYNKVFLRDRFFSTTGTARDKLAAMLFGDVGPPQVEPVKLPSEMGQKTKIQLTAERTVWCCLCRGAGMKLFCLREELAAELAAVLPCKTVSGASMPSLCCYVDCCILLLINQIGGWAC